MPRLLQKPINRVSQPGAQDTEQCAPAGAVILALQPGKTWLAPRTADTGRSSALRYTHRAKRGRTIRTCLTSVPHPIMRTLIFAAPLLALALVACNKQESASTEASKAMDAAKESAAQAVDAAKEAASKAGDAAGKAIEAGKEKAAEGFDKARDAAANAKDAAGQKYDAAKAAAGEKYDEAKAAAERAVEAARNASSDKK